MTLFDAILLGLLQGLTEFLPISSSGHLVLTQSLLGVKESGVTFEVLLHLGSLLAVLVYFQKRICDLTKALFTPSMKTERAIIFYLVIGTIPAVIVALLFKEFIRNSFSNPLLTSAMLLVTGFILLSTRFFKLAEKPIKLKPAILMGIGQAMAILPGISRSGTTIATGMIVGVKPAEAAEFSFLLAIPAILGAVVFNLHEISSVDNSLIIPYLGGVLVTFVSSLIAIYLVLALIKKGKFSYFAYYCFAVGALGLYLFS